MDFLDFEGQDLYFDEPVSSEVAGLIGQAAEVYPDDAAEAYLLRSYFLEPDHLTVLVALYRYFYYRHRYDDALVVAERATKIAGERLGLVGDWSELTAESLTKAIDASMSLTRFYLMVVKAAGYLEMRMGNFDKATAYLQKVVSLDPRDQFGAGFLLKLAKSGQLKEAGDNIECLF